MTTLDAAPEMLVDKWFNTDHPRTLSGLRGRASSYGSEKRTRISLRTGTGLASRNTGL
jgi:hypothetical protein